MTTISSETAAEPATIRFTEATADNTRPVAKGGRRPRSRRNVATPSHPPSSAPKLRAMSVHAVPGAHSQPVCKACGKPLTGKQQQSCSARCRADLSRRRQADACVTRDREVRSLLEQALRLLERP